MITSILYSAAALPHGQQQDHTLASISEAGAAPIITCSATDSDNCTCGGKPIGHSVYVPPAWLGSTKGSIYDTSAKVGRKETSLANYKAKVAMIVNVASG